jgi:hypothetical protein
MASLSNNDTLPKRGKWIVIGLVVVVFALALLLFPSGEPLPISVAFVNTSEGYHPPMIPDVPCFSIRNEYRGQIEMHLQLEIQSNDVWLPWPPHSATNTTTTTATDIELAQWHEYVMARETKLIHPVQRPSGTSMAPMRLHGFVGKEKLGAAAWPQFAIQYVRNRWFRPKPNLTSLPLASLTSVKTLAVSSPPQARFFYTGREFVTSPLCLTNTSGALNVVKFD